MFLIITSNFSPLPSDDDDDDDQDDDKKKDQPNYYADNGCGRTWWALSALTLYFLSTKWPRERCWAAGYIYKKST